MLLPIGAAAQSDGFNFPDDINFLQQPDPNLRRATARVNGNIITGTDVDHRVALIVASNEAQIPPEQMQSLRLQVLRSLIDETLQVQEAVAQEMEVTAEEVNESYASYALEQFNRTPEQMDEFLTSIGASPRTMKRQIQGQLAWERLLRRNVTPFINVSAEEVNELLAQMQASRGQFEYRIGEIYLSANPNTRDQVRANAQQIVNLLRQGGSFVAAAQTYSEASSKVTGGDLGWLQLERLQNPTMEGAVREMVPGQLVGPLEIPGGFSIIYLIDKRQIGMSDPRDAVLSLKQVSIEFAPGTTETEAQLRAEQFASAVEQFQGCGDADARAAAIGATVQQNDQMSARDLPEALQTLLLRMNVGEATPPFGDLQNGVRVLLLCGRDDPPAQAQAPQFDQLMNSLEQERINRRAQSYLRDLRRDAVIDYD
ncbi:peptidylprolyl isomerase [Altererythrobacter buctensis]|uniref:Parvulin-like PPIase n=2 Tax=Alteraurantiacibacter buctensis TaxID=1503981 RepID=A0A844YXW7_9SPHN|nr:peptidylprolyl isomerase [Alteraurantiacibacter buctensis]MXO72032.1 peptidylprolyl isomerase [Alteraurantiacibacter buctensis]